MDARQILISLAVSENGDWDKIFCSIKKHDTPQSDLSKGVKCITILDDNYPSIFKEKCLNPPFVLFYDGDLSLLDNAKKLSVVSSDYSLESALDAFRLLENEDVNVIVGGVENSLDKTVISITKGKPIAVLPCGIDKFDKDLADLIRIKGGLIISEFPNGTEKTIDRCPFRHRIIECLANKTLVLEASKSALIRINFALQYGNDIYVVPKSLDKASDYINNQLIKEGAILCDSFEQLCE